MNKYINKFVYIGFLLLMFLKSSAQDVEVDLINFKYNPAPQNTITFDLQMKAASGYISGDYDNGQWEFCDIRWEIYLESGVTIDKPAAILTTNTAVLGLAEIYSGYAYSYAGTVPTNALKYAISLGRERTASNDLTTIPVKVVSVTFPVLTGTPTNATYIKPRVGSAGNQSNWSSQNRLWRTPFTFSATAYYLNSPLTAIDTAICEGTTLDLAGLPTLVGNETFAFYTNADRTGLLTDTKVTPVGPVTKYYFCSSLTCPDLDTITVRVNPLPGISHRDTTVCRKQQVDLSTLVVSDGTVAYYKEMFPVEPTVPLVTPHAPNARYYVQATHASGCRSIIDTVTIRLNPLPTLSTNNLSICMVQAVDLTTLASSSGNTLNFYEDAAATLPVSTTPTLVAGINKYYVQAVNANTCKSDIDSITITTVSLAKPVIKATEWPATCDAGGSVVLTLNNKGAYTANAAIAWYNKNNNQIGGGGVEVFLSGKYYVKVYDQGCISDTTNYQVVVDVTVKTTPTLATNNLSMCTSREVDLNTLAASNAHLNFYTNVDTTTEVADPNAVNPVSPSSTYYVVASNDYCRSQLQTITITVGDMQRPVVTATLKNATCTSPAQAVLKLNNVNVYAANAGLVWYNEWNQQIGAGDSITVYTSGKYYTKVFDNPCSSDTSAHYVVTLDNTLKTIPALTKYDLSLCSSQAVDLTTLASTNGMLHFYGDVAATWPIAAIQTPTLSVNKYYVQASNAECTSRVDSIIITVGNMSKPVITSTLSPTTCTNPAQAVLKMNRSGYSAAAGMVWYNAADQQIGAGDSITVYASGKYYAKIFDNACVSDTSEHDVILDNMVKIVPTLTKQDIVLCAAQTIDLNTLAMTNGDLHFYSDATATIPVPASQLLTSGENKFYVQASNTYCTSRIDSIVITVGNMVRPVVTGVLTAAECSSPAQAILKIDNRSIYAANAGLVWFNESGQQIGAGDSITVYASGKYYAKVFDHPCVSDSSLHFRVSLDQSMSKVALTVAPTTTVCATEAQVSLGCSCIPGRSVYYKLSFNEEALAAGFRGINTFTLLENDEIPVDIPAGVQAKNYVATLHVQDTACVELNTDKMVINVLSRVAIEEQPVSEYMVCDGNDASLTLSVKSNMENVTYQWYRNGIAISGATGAVYSKTSVTEDDLGNYTVKVMGSCDTITSHMAAVKTNDVSVYVKWNDVLFVSERDTLGNKMEIKSYQWYRVSADGTWNPIVEKGQSQYYSEKGLSGTFAVEVTYSNGDKKTSCPYVLVTVAERIALKIYPNPLPVNHKLNVELILGTRPAEGSLIQIFDITGRVIAEKTAVSALSEFYLQTSSGTYFVKTTDPEGDVQTEKFIIQ